MLSAYFSGILFLILWLWAPGSSSDSGVVADEKLSETSDQSAISSSHADYSLQQLGCETSDKVGGRYYVTKNGVNFRTSPSAQAEKVVGQSSEAISLGKRHILQGICAKGDWLKAQIVELNGKPTHGETGWVLRTLVTEEVSFVCRATVSKIMGRDISTIQSTGVEAGIASTRYSRPDDGTIWLNRCKIEDGNRIIWATDTGRWRTDQADEKLSFQRTGEFLTVKEIFADGSSSEEKFELK